MKKLVFILTIILCGCANNIRPIDTDIEKYMNVIISAIENYNITEWYKDGSYIVTKYNGYEIKLNGTHNNILEFGMGSFVSAISLTENQQKRLVALYNKIEKRFDYIKKQRELKFLIEIVPKETKI